MRSTDSARRSTSPGRLGCPSLAPEGWRHREGEGDGICPCNGPGPRVLLLAMDLYLERLATPIGKLLIVSDDTRLRAVDFGDREDRMRAWVRRDWGDVRLV